MYMNILTKNIERINHYHLKGNYHNLLDRFRSCTSFIKGADINGCTFRKRFIIVEDHLYQIICWLLIKCICKINSKWRLIKRKNWTLIWNQCPVYF